MGTTSSALLGIQDTIAGYAQAYDSRDPVELRRMLAADCRITVSMGRFAGQEFVGADRIVDWLAGTWPVTPPCLHLTGNVRVRDEPGGVLAVSDYLFVVRTAEGGLRVASAGRYSDRVEYREGSWVIAERDVGPRPG